MDHSLILLVTSPRVAPGLLSREAWTALEGAHAVWALEGEPQALALEEAGVEVAFRPEEAPELLGRALVEACADGDVVWVGSSDGDPGLNDAIATEVTRLSDPPDIELLVGSHDVPGSRLLDVVAVMDRLRSPGGCPWDAQQTHTSLMPYLLEEAYETYEALENGDLPALREELGDLLLQILFHARIADDFGIDEVSGDLVDKLVRRHPHVFAGASADDLEGSWERLKQAEKGRSSVTEGVPLGQPALALAAKLQRRAGKLGAPAVAFDGLGGRLWELVALCQDAGLDPEVELRRVARAFRDRLAELERAGLPSTPEGWRSAFA
jgi:XTP/dITP diphosphohydrolase